MGALPDLTTSSASNADVLDLVARLDDTADAPQPLPTPTAVFQPIVHLEAGVAVGFEALARFADGVSPREHFQRADAEGRAVELELACCDAAVRHLSGLPHGTFLSTNVSAACAARRELALLLRTIDTTRLAIELTQQSPVDDVAVLDHHLAAIRATGVRLAVDDVGVDGHPVEHVQRFAPAIVKASPRLVSGCDTDAELRARLAAVVEIGRRVGAITVAVGVERKAEADVLRRLGFDAAQGYLFARPEPLEYHTRPADR
ncbi:MAG: EAL domain-containing protein [Actinomycetota bacterium]